MGVLMWAPSSVQFELFTLPSARALVLEAAHISLLIAWCAFVYAVRMQLSRVPASPADSLNPNSTQQDTRTFAAAGLPSRESLMSIRSKGRGGQHGATEFKHLPDMPSQAAR